MRAVTVDTSADPRGSICHQGWKLIKRAQRRQLPRLYVPVVEPEDVIRHLGRQEAHWKEGFSAHALVTKWFSANGIPEAVKSALSKHDQFRGAEFIDGFFERQVDLQSAGRPSQTDLLALINVGNRVAVMAVEGKVDEPFGEIVRDWLEGRKRKTSEPAILSKRGARTERLEGLWLTLGMKESDTHKLRYQLLHRAASAIYEAKRYRADLAVLIVHSFSEDASGFGRDGRLPNGPPLNGNRLQRRAAHRDIRTGIVILSSKVRVVPPNTISRMCECS